MNKFFTTLVISIGLIIISFPFAFSEDLTITTYYPSPYGVYANLRSDQMSIGSGYRATTLPSNGLIIEGQVSIGATSAASYGGTQTELDVNGEIAASDVWVKNKSKWLGSLSWCTMKTYGPDTGNTLCGSGTTYSWFQPIYGTSPTTYDIPTSGSFLCCG